MAKKSKENEQFNNPFSALRGLSVSGESERPAKEVSLPAGEAKAEAVPAEPQSEEAVDFDQAMAGLGVKAIDRSGLDKPLPAAAGVQPSADTVTGAQTEKRESGGSALARPRRQKRLRRGEVMPEAELDLHGARAEEVHDRIGWFLENAMFHGFEAVRIITGKGNRSVDGPIVRPLVESYLDGPGRKLVVEWMRAPQRQGGEGAIVVFLRSGGG